VERGEEGGSEGGDWAEVMGAQDRPGPALSKSCLITKLVGKCRVEGDCDVESHIWLPQVLFQAS
jgi:hypothetical protein